MTKTTEIDVGVEFQSTPPAEARGDHGQDCDRRGHQRVSIHSPRRSEGRRVRRALQAGEVRFQSTPPAEARGDLRSACTWRWSCAGFNPLPPPKRGETCPVDPPAIEDTKVSIHSPRRSEGRPLVNSMSVIPSVFQSTPPAEARGDSGR